MLCTYRVLHLVVHLVWVWFGYSTTIFPSSAKFHSAKAKPGRRWNMEHSKSKWTQPVGERADGTPCKYIHTLKETTLDSANPHSPFPKAPKSKRQAKKTKIGKERDDRMFQLRLVKSLNRGIKMTKSYLPANPGSMDRHSSWICEASDSRALQENIYRQLKS